MGEKHAKTKRLHTDYSADVACHIEFAVDESAWDSLKEENEELVQAVEQWVWNLRVPKDKEGERWGDTYFYRQFEFSPPPEKPESKKYEKQKIEFLRQYEKLQCRYPSGAGCTLEATPEKFMLERNPVLCNICNVICLEKNSGKHIKDCSVRKDFTKGLYASFIVELPRTRGLRSDTKQPLPQKSILLHDLRFLGHPVTVELKYTDIQNPQKRALLRNLVCCYPGSDKRTIRYSKRLGERIDEALANGMSPSFISEASAIPLDSIYHWRNRDMRKAKKALPTATMQFSLFHCQDFSTISLPRHMTFLTSGFRTKKYQFVFRKESGRPLRLLAVYPQHEWNMCQKLISGHYNLSNLRRPFSSISAFRMFNLAMDYLSDSENALLCSAGSASPVLGAFLFLALREDFRADTTFLFQKFDDTYAAFYQSCYEDLVKLYWRLNSNPTYALPQALSYLIGPNIPSAQASAFETAIRKWRAGCELSATKNGLHLPLCDQSCRLSESEQQFIDSQALPDCIPPSWDSDIESMSDLTARLLIFNPVTLSTIHGGQDLQTRYVPQTLTDSNRNRYRCASKEDGTLDFDNVIPGIGTAQLKSLLEQGFLHKSRTSLFQKDSPFE